MRTTHPIKAVGVLVCKKAHFALHLTYLGLVSVESHGLYGMAAGALGLVVVTEATIEYLNGRDAKHSVPTEKE